jgi:hypothetical protein
MTACAALAIALLALSGCNSRPRAPALEDDAVYHNPDEGFRFLVPSGWKQRAKALTPRGKVADDYLLVQYARESSKGGESLFEVSLIDLPGSSDISALLSSSSHSYKEWRASGTPQQINVGGVQATRFTFAGSPSKTPMTKEVVVFRKGERAYLFTGVFRTDDKQARDDIQGAVASIIWKN